MARTTVEIRGLKRLVRKLDRMGVNMRPTLEDATLKAVLHVHEKIPPYSSVPSRGSYRRTGTLGRSVTSIAGSSQGALSRVTSLGAAIVGIIGTAVQYAKWVIGERTQVWFHRGRWYTLEGVVRKNSKSIRKIYERALRDLIRKS